MMAAGSMAAEAAGMRVCTLSRFPVKGLSAEALESVELRAGHGFPLDRMYAVTDGSLDFDAAHPVPAPKTQFLMLAKHESLARLRTRLRTDDHVLEIEAAGEPRRDYPLNDAQGRDALAAFLGTHVAVPLAGTPRVVQAEGHQFTDVSVHSVALMRSISLINLDTVRSLSAQVGVELDPLRFRGNLVFEGAAPWSELDWVGKTLHIDEVELRVVRRTRRCSATSVDPATGVRGANVPLAIREMQGHMDLGIYAEVVRGGLLRRGARMVLKDAATTDAEAPQ